jgi:AcrR family transcriptional regulator
LKSVKPNPAPPNPAVSDKREQILQGAMQVFLQRGYAGTSMDRLAAIANVSKQTIYSHFQDKEGLFTALIEGVTIGRLQAELGAELWEGEPEPTLRGLAIAYLNKMGDEEYLSLLRVVIGESIQFPELAQLYTRTVIQRGQRLICDYFKVHPELQLTDPEATARIFMGSLVSFLISQEILYGKKIMPFEQERLVDQLVKMALHSS